MILKTAIEKVEKILSVLPKDILEKLKISKYRTMILNPDEEIRFKLFNTYCLIFQYIAHKENINVDRNVLTDYTTMNILEYLNGIFYDSVYDNKDIIKLPAANILFRHYIRLAEDLNIEIDRARDTFECYFYKPNTVKIGKIDMDTARELDVTWAKTINGFATSVNIVDHYVKYYIKNEKWSHFFRNYLLYRQLLDDVNDFVQDYKNNEIKSYGLLALVKFFKSKKKINLKNPVTAFFYQLYVLRNYKKIYDEIIMRFEEEVSRTMQVEEFYRIMDELEEFQDKYDKS